MVFKRQAASVLSFSRFLFIMVLHFFTGWLLLGLSTGDPIEFDPFFGGSDTSFFSPQEGPFGAFSGFSFGPSGARFDSDFQEYLASESPSLPIYRDGVATPPQVTLSRLEKDYKAQLQSVAQFHPGSLAQQRRPQQSPRQGRKQYPVFQSDPFPSASNVDERKPARKEAEKPQTTLGPNSKPVEVQTGFIPIIKSSSGQEKRLNSQNIATAVIKDMEPPILTAASVLSSRPTLFKVSASVLSSAKAPAQRSLNESAIADLAKSRKASYARFLAEKNDSKSLIFPSESARVASDSQVRRQIISPLGEDAKLAAKKTLDINCDGSRDLGWCELGDKYPKKYVDQVIASCQDVIQRMHVEVPHSFEKLSDNSNFKAELDNSSSQRSARERGNHDAWSWAAYFHQGSLCDAETGFLRPETAKDSSGKWNIIVQTDAIKQRVPIEMCRKTNGPCKKTTNCGLKSQCLQKYNYHLLMSLNPTQKHDCPFMKLYRFPSACVCHVE